MRPTLRLMILLVPVLGGCGGSGGSSGEVNSSGWGWVEIQVPTSEPSYETSADSVSLSGGAFVRSENGGTTADVTWLNTTTGESGAASSSFVYEWQCFLWYCQWGETGHMWSAVVPLAPGENVIMVEARTNAYNWAREYINVVRVAAAAPGP